MPKLTKTALKRKQPVTDELLIPVDDAQAQMLADARSALGSALQGLGLVQMAGESDEAPAEQRVKAAREKLEAVKDEIRKTGLSIVLVSAGQERWDELMLENPPTDEQKQKAEQDGEDEPLYNPDTFWPALVAATADSDLTADDWRREVFQSKAWGPEEISELKNRAAGVYQRSRIVALGN